MKRYILIGDSKLNKSINNTIQMGGSGEFNEKYIFPYINYDTKSKRLKKLDELKKKCNQKKNLRGIYILLDLVQLVDLY